MDETTEPSDDATSAPRSRGELAIRLLHELAQYDQELAKRMRELGLDQDSEA
jgi:hypothetical protein